MVFIRGKEKEVENLYKTHIDRVDECLTYLNSVVQLYLAEDPGYRKEALKVHKAEHEADIIRREIEKKVHEGAFLAVFRGDFIWLAESIDKIANLAESVADIIVIENPKIPKELAPLFKELLKSSIEAFKPFTELNGIISSDAETVLAKAREVEDREQITDRLEFSLLERIFNSGVDFAHKLHLKELVKRVAGLANLAEDASDRLEVMLAKRKV